jgi:hypothetical protein
MATKEGAETACKEPNPIIDGRRANVNLAILGAKPRAGGQLISGITVNHRGQYQPRHPWGQAQAWLSADIRYIIVDHRGQCQPHHPWGQAQGWWSA